ncbi:MAG: hypothetical protein QW035_01535 [Candidatus Anstonellales archaeon]
MKEAKKEAKEQLPTKKTPASIKQAFKKFFSKEEEKPQKPRNIIFDLDSYNDLFSDFDAGLPEERMISKDLAHEIRDKASNIPIAVPIHLIFRLPEEKRVDSIEKILKKRIPLMFSDALENAKKEAKLYLRTSKYLFGISAIMIVAESAVASFIPEATAFLSRVLRTVMEIMTWLPAVFGVEFLERLIAVKAKEVKPLKRLSQITVSFKSVSIQKEEEAKQQDETTPAEPIQRQP